MKRSFRILCYFAVLLLFTVVGNFNSTMEVETDVQPKFGQCLDKFGGTVSLKDGGSGNGNDFGGKTEVHADSDWRKESVEVKVHAYASSWDDINEIHVRLYNSKGFACEDKDILDLLNIREGTFSDIEFTITFSGKDVWQNIQVWQVDTSDKIGSKGKDKIKLDVTKPEVKKFDVSKDSENLKVDATIMDNYSKLNTKKISLKVSNPSTNYQKVFSESKNAKNNSRNVNVTIPISEIGDGDITVVLKAEDKAGNIVEQTKTLTTAVDPDTGEEVLVEETVDTSPDSGDDGSGGSGEDSEALITSIGAIGKNDYEFTCDDDIKEFINDLWSYVLILGPVLMLVLCTIEFVKALMASDADAVNKATSNTLKRTIAFVILMLLKVIMGVLFSIFGIEVCW